MSTQDITTEKLEAINDMIAEAIDEAQGHSELFLAKALFHLAVHHVTVEDLKDTIEKSLSDLD